MLQCLLLSHNIILLLFSQTCNYIAEYKPSNLVQRRVNTEEHPGVGNDQVVQAVVGRDPNFLLLRKPSH